ncbi:MAG: corrinoid protein [Firmicutes bacterium]|nr:corrinoid protein [Bacillota bacterium]
MLGVQAEADEEESGDILFEIAKAVEKGQASKVVKLLESEEASALEPKQILDEALIVAMNKVGEDFSDGEVFVPEMLLAAKAMQAALEILRPKMVDDNAESLGKACIGTVKGDLHDIGKNLVKVMMEGSGIEVIDLGTDVSAEKFVQTVKDEGCDIICCSSLLTTTVWEMKNVVDACKDAGIRDDVLIMIGGAPVTQHFCEEIGADIYSVDAGQAAKKAVEVLKQRA